MLFTAPYSNSFFFFAENFYFDFSKIWCWNYEFPWYAKIRENRSFRKRWLKLEYSISQTLFLSIINFSSYWLRPHCEKSRKMFLSAIEINPFKMNQQPNALKSNFQVESSIVKQKNFKTTHVRKRYLIDALFYIYLDFKYQMFCISES